VVLRKVDTHLPDNTVSSRNTINYYLNCLKTTSANNLYYFFLYLIYYTSLTKRRFSKTWRTLMRSVLYVMCIIFLQNEPL
jgi:hypothetical protein